MFFINLKINPARHSAKSAKAKQGTKEKISLAKLVKANYL